MLYNNYIDLNYNNWIFFSLFDAECYDMCIQNHKDQDFASIMIELSK
jgi:hypothetical protein